MAKNEQLPEASLPALPEEVETWIRDAAESTQALVTLHRRAQTRFARLAAWTRDKDGDLHDWVLDQVRVHVVEHGSSVFGLERIGAERLVWMSSLAFSNGDTEITIENADPQSLVEASWRVTFRCAAIMMENLSVVPRLVKEVGDMHRDAIALMAGAATQSEGVTMAMVQSEQSTKKLDRVIGVLERFGGPATKDMRPPEPDRTSGMVRKLLSALTDDDRALVLADEIGRRLVVVEEWSELQKGISELWARVREGKLMLSKESLAACDKVIEDAKAKPAALAAKTG